MLTASDCIFEDSWTDIFKDTHYFFLCPAEALLRLDGTNFDKDAAEKKYGPVVDGCIEIVVREAGSRTISAALVCELESTVDGDESYQDVGWTDLTEGVDTEDDTVYMLIGMAEEEIAQARKFWEDNKE